MTTLRKQLGATAIVTVSGRGHRWALRPDRSPTEAPPLSTNVADDGLRRDDIVADVLASFDAGTPLVTLTGPGGAGKTRIAQRVAALRGREQACWFVMLAPARDMAQFWAAVAGVLGLGEWRGAAARAGARGSRRALHSAVLDNLEHLPDAAEAVASLHATCPRVQWLVTSRTLLHVLAERVQRVPPLGEEAATELFRCCVGRRWATAERGRARDRVAGLLLTRLAATRASSSPPRACARSARPRSPPAWGSGSHCSRRPGRCAERYKTLRDTISSCSHGPVRRAQALFRRLGVFVGWAWSLEAARPLTSNPSEPSTAWNCCSITT